MYIYIYCIICFSKTSDISPQPKSVDLPDSQTGNLGIVVTGDDFNVFFGN